MKKVMILLVSLFVLSGGVALAGDLGMNFKANIQGTFVSSTALTLGISYCF